MKTKQQIETWQYVLGFAYDNLSASEFDYLMDESPFDKFIANALPETEIREEWNACVPFEPISTTTLYFQ